MPALIYYLCILSLILSPTSAVLKFHRPAKHAVVVSDLKMDDLGAIHALAKAPETEHVHVIGSNLINHAAAKGHLDDFMSQMGHQGKYTYYGGQPTVVDHEITSTHEQNFVGRPSTVRKQAKEVYDNVKRKASVDVYHIAPAHPALISDLVTDHRVDLKTYHHIQGYNSIVSGTKDKKKDGKATHRFLSNIGQTVKGSHRDADVIFSNSAKSFTDSVGGSTQPLRVLRDTFPANHLHSATLDPFHVRQLHTIEKNVVSKKRRQGVALPPLHPSNHAEQLTPGKVHGALYGKDVALRKHLTSYVQHALPHIDQHGDQKLAHRARNGVLKALRNADDPMVEMCDGVHVEACLQARRKRDRSAFRPVQFTQKFDSGSKTSTTGHVFVAEGKQHGHFMVDQKGGDYARSLSRRIH